MQNLERVTIAEEIYYKIANVDGMRPFLMSLVSPDNHWMFISSNGGLTAGRKNAEYALFPYYTDDKLTEMAEVTGSKTILRVGGKAVWEPFSIRSSGRGRRCNNLYKSRLGNKVIFEEIDEELGLCFRYGWSTSDVHGFVRTAELINQGEQALDISLVDGLQNLLPYGVESALQKASSNLVDAYKRSELEKTTGLGIYALSAIIVDKAEPSEALKANVVWSHGLEGATHLLSSRQLDAFRDNGTVQEETDVKGAQGAYFLQQAFSLPAGGKKEWILVANVNQDRSGVAATIAALRNPTELVQRVREDVKAGTARLTALAAAADGLQRTDDHRYDSRHFANVLFNIMRGGIFDDNYRIERADFLSYLTKANHRLGRQYADRINKLSEIFTLPDLRALTAEIPDPDFQRLTTEYLPLKFSRRHGDPSRPWNRFSINTRRDDGTKILDYEGNWRDIFQNWETLAHAYPDFMEGMIHKFLNATTADGYNPYRVTKGGFDWETIEPDDPWSYIGYWGDHQLIYLLKFLEFQEKHRPGSLTDWREREVFVYANVPYRIKPYADLLANPKDTIDFAHELDAEIRNRREEKGADGALLQTADGAVCRANFVEKILVTLLAKIANFIPEGGIWMNTQRPEWNDANNALVGNGVSMVTLYYLRRFLSFLLATWEQDDTTLALNADLSAFLRSVHRTLIDHARVLVGSIADDKRKAILDEFGHAAETYREQVYTNALVNERTAVSLTEIRDFLRHTLTYVDHTIAANRRVDGLYHAYNLMTVHQGGVRISYLDEMLEGQVAVLSAGYLSDDQVLEVLDGMKASKLFREDQYSYLLYPNKDLPGFLEKNTVPPAAVERSVLLQRMVAEEDTCLISQDVAGEYHFNGNFRNAKQLA
ncbi:MAG: hypothetical protein AAFN92_07800, partial [Bacteroidota bacterium]